MVRTINGILQDMNLDTLIEKIIQKPLFLKLKDVVENNSYHNHENIYDHLIKTKDIALKEIKANFISNPTAKKGFLEFINEDSYGYKKGDLMILIALLHDVGKILSVKEGNITRSIVITDEQGQTTIPGHEYWGSTIVDQFLQGLNLNPEVIKYIAKIVGLHGVFQGEYLPTKINWILPELLNDVKSRAEGYYIESMFNNYCDVFTALPFQPFKQTVIDVFNEPSLYEKRKYVIL